MLTAVKEIRPLEVGDTEALTACLARNFDHVSQRDWRSRIDRVGALNAGFGDASIGFGLFFDGVLRGTVLTLHSQRQYGQVTSRVVNMSSWCIDQDCRGPKGLALYTAACAGDRAMFSNLSPAIRTISFVERQGFHKRSSGQMCGIGVARGSRGVRLLSLGDAVAEGLEPWMVEMLEAHEQAGCIARVLRTGNGLIPLLFLRRRVKPGLPCAQLILCPDMAMFSAHAGLISANLAMLGLPLLLIDCDGPLPGVAGKYFAGRSVRYYKGEVPWQGVDHCHSELVWIGF